MGTLCLLLSASAFRNHGGPPMYFFVVPSGSSVSRRNGEFAARDFDSQQHFSDQAAGCSACETRTFTRSVRYSTTLVGLGSCSWRYETASVVPNGW